MASIVDISEVLLNLGLSDSATPEQRAVCSMAITHAEGAVRRHLRYDPVRRTRTEFYPQSDFTDRSSPHFWDVVGNVAVLNRASTHVASELQLLHIPIRSITSLYVDLNARSGTTSGAFGSSTSKTEGTDFWANYDLVDSASSKVCRDGILRSQGLWPSTPGSVKVIYTAGYTSDELHGQDSVIDASPIWSSIVDEAVRRAQTVLVNKRQQEIGFTAGPIISERLGDYSVTHDASIAARLFGSTMDITPQTRERLAEFVNWAFVL